MNLFVQLGRNVSSLKLKDAWLAMVSVTLVTGLIGGIVLELNHSSNAHEEIMLGLDANLLAIDLEAESILNAVPASMAIDELGGVTFNSDPMPTAWANLDEDTHLEFYQKSGETYAFCLVRDSGSWALYDSEAGKAVTGREGNCGEDS